VSRTKVVTRRNGWRRLLALMCVSLAVVILAFVTQRWTDYTRPAVVSPGVVTGASSIHVGNALVLLLLLPLWLAVLSWSEQRWWYAVLEALAVWLSMVIAMMSLLLAHPGLSPRLPDDLGPAIALAVIYLLVRLIALAFVRFLVVSVVYQDGSLCSSCGYNLTGNVSGICPECGTPCEQRTGGAASTP
jgi:hypothetical protein